MSFFELSLLVGLALGGLVGGWLWDGVQTVGFSLLAIPLFTGRFVICLGDGRCRHSSKNRSQKPINHHSYGFIQPITSPISSCLASCKRRSRFVADPYRFSTHAPAGSWAMVGWTIYRNRSRLFIVGICNFVCGGCIGLGLCHGAIRSIAGDALGSCRHLWHFCLFLTCSIFLAGGRSIGDGLL